MAEGLFGGGGQRPAGGAQAPQAGAQQQPFLRGTAYIPPGSPLGRQGPYGPTGPFIPEEQPERQQRPGTFPGGHYGGSPGQASAGMSPQARLFLSAGAQMNPALGAALRTRRAGQPAARPTGTGQLIGGLPG